MRSFDPYSYKDSVDIELTQDQTEVIKTAIALLQPMNTIKVPSYQHYFTDGENGDDLCIEVCNEDSCVAEIVNRHPNAVAFRWSNDGDHEKIDTCEVCGAQLNASLTWIDQEFEYLSEDVKTIEDIKTHAFELLAVFGSYPSADERISGYDRHQAKMGNFLPLNNKLKAQERHAEKVVAYAQLIINEINKANG